MGFRGKGLRVQVIESRVLILGFGARRVRMISALKKG